MRTFSHRNVSKPEDAIPAFCASAVYGRKRRSPKWIAGLVLLTGLGLLFFQGGAGFMWGVY